MIGSDQLLRAYIQRVRGVSGARIVSLYLPGPIACFARPVLLHEGELPALPELSDLSAAESLGRGLGARNEPAQIVRSDQEGGWLIHLPSLVSVLPPSRPPVELPGEPRRRKGDQPFEGSEPSSQAWLGMRLDKGDDPRAAIRSALDSLGTPSPCAASSWTWLLPVGGALSWHNQQVSVLLRDPVSQLPGRTVLQAVLASALERARSRAGQVSLLLMNPDQLVLVNERFGREGGDAVVREIADRLRETLRIGDFVCRYGGAVFGVALPDVSAKDAGSVASKLRETLTEGSYLNGSYRLGFSFGAAMYEPSPKESPEDATLKLIRRADQALNGSKLAGGERITIWCRDAELEEVGQLDRLSGIFTANQAKDYRNMLLLWDTIRAVASSDDVERLVGQVLDKIAAAFHPERAALFEPVADGGYRLTRGVARGAGGSEMLESDDGSWADEQRSNLVNRARREGKPAEGPLTCPEGSGGRVGCAIPLSGNDRFLAAIFLEGERASLQLDSSDLILLKALAGQLAVAMDRARLADDERARLEQEHRVLREELEELRHVLQEAKLIQRSPAMEAVLASVRRVAPTDATVLISGESGTGKELIARTLHALSPRRDRPLIVVDCSAIATTLIDSELFGHERGAYTGAEKRAPGRLAEADGGTILLDEIGELPQEVQGKLLRFVQEKQFTPVGSTRPRSVDVRVVAATNRILQREVAAGTFREDLYYRLKVIQIEIPPLRERPEDIPLLATHFVDKFALQYQKGPRRLSSDAETRMLQYAWPGNVRELQNRAMQAVILAEGEEIGSAEFGLDTGPPVVDGRPEEVARSRNRPVAGDPWGKLRPALREVLREAARPQRAYVLPVGKWIGDGLVLEAYRSTEQVSSRAAAWLGVAETTFRRRQKKAAARAELRAANRVEEWDAVNAAIAGVVACGNPSGEDLLLRVRRLLLEEVVELVRDDARVGAALMGVTDPTYRRWTAELTPDLVTT